MKFNVFPHMRIIHILGYVMHFIFIALGIWKHFAAFYDETRPEPIFVSCMFLIFILIQFSYRKTAFSTIFIDQNGISCKCFLSTTIFIPWDECVEVGIAGYRRGRYDLLLTYMLYFSKKAMTEDLINKPQSRMNSDYIRLQCRKDVLDEVLKYIDKEKIKGLSTSTLW